MTGRPLRTAPFFPGFLAIFLIELRRPRKPGRGALVPRPQRREVRAGYAPVWTADAWTGREAGG